MGPTRSLDPSTQDPVFTLQILPKRLIMFLKSLFYILIFFNDSIVGVRGFESLSSPIKLQDSWTK
jgi:hypothetical protein